MSLFRILSDALFSLCLMFFLFLQRMFSGMICIVFRVLHYAFFLSCSADHRAARGGVGQPDLTALSGRPRLQLRAAEKDTSAVVGRRF